MKNSNVTQIPPKRGRERLNENEKRLSVVKLYLTSEEKAWLQELRKQSGYKQDSRFIYELIKETATSGHFAIESQIKVNADLTRAIQGVANNCNQSMAFTHSTGSSMQLEQFRKELFRFLRILKKVSDEIKQHKESKQINFPNALTLKEMLSKLPSAA
ncbi:hypothetical protein [Thalassotalea sp. SU-HH00458]|uniref:hypothetical protein n=1 Tax=Thalassotalea sp. SU-HH00458 TaxID=3127657 RepID=UPI003103C9FC